MFMIAKSFLKLIERKPENAKSPSKTLQLKKSMDTTTTILNNNNNNN